MLPKQKRKTKMNWTLNFDEILTLYSQYIKADAYHYYNSELDIDITHGDMETCRFIIPLDSDMGSLSLPFIPDLLPYNPIRNAVLYHRALKMANTDPLTGVYNRYSFDSCLSREFQLAIRNNHTLSLLFIDIDDFKIINDTYGHDYGDIVLKKVAGIIQRTSRSSDVVFRYGGEEFVVILNDTNQDGAVIIAERIQANLANTVTVSIGVSSMSEIDTIHTLVKRADDAMYYAKTNGKNQIQILS